MAQSIAISLEKLNTALEGDKTALTDKKVSVPSTTKHSDVPQLITQIKSGQSSLITVQCSEEYEGTTLTFTNGSDKMTAKVVGGKCEVTVEKEGTWVVTNTLDDQEISCVVEFSEYSLNLEYAVTSFVQAGTGDQFASAINQISDFYNAVNLRISDEKAPSSVKTYDVSKAKDNSVCLWKDGDTVVVSTQKRKARVQFTETTQHVSETCDYGSDFEGDYSIFNHVETTISGNEEEGEYIYVDVYAPFENIDLSGADFSATKSLSNLFYAQEVTSLDLSQATGLEGGHITDISYLFCGCDKLTSLNLGQLDTTNVTDMSYLFANTKLSQTTLQNLISKLNTKKVKNMRHMFGSNSQLNSLNLSDFDTSSATDMSGMFYYCDGLTSITLTGLNTSKVTDMSYMFFNCKSLPSLNLSNFRTTYVTNMSNMFSGCQALTTLNISGFSTSSVTDMSAMFKSTGLTSSSCLSYLNTSSVKNMDSMFEESKMTGTFNPSGFTYSNVTSAYAMFQNSAFSSINLSKFYGTNTKLIGYLVNGCKNLTQVDLRNFSVTSLQNYTKNAIAQCFGDCPRLTTIYGKDWSSRTDLNNWYVFQGSTSLPSYNSKSLTITMAKPKSQGGYFTSA